MLQEADHWYQSKEKFELSDFILQDQVLSLYCAATMDIVYHSLKYACGNFIALEAFPDESR